MVNPILRDVPAYIGRHRLQLFGTVRHRHAGADALQHFSVIIAVPGSRPPMDIILHLAQRAPSTAGAARFFRAFGLDFYAVTVSKEAFFKGWDTVGRGLTVPALSSRFSGNSRLFLDILPRCSKIKILPPRQKSAYKPYTPKGE